VVFADDEDDMSDCGEIAKHRRYGAPRARRQRGEANQGKENQTPTATASRPRPLK
jgi:hypothetical protein